MGTLALVDARTWVGGYDMTGDLNTIGLDISWDALDNTPFGSLGRSRQAGLEVVEGQDQGFWQSGTAGQAVDPVVFSALGGATQPVTQSATIAETSVAYFWQAKTFNYSLGGDIGTVMPFSLGMQSGRAPGERTYGAKRGQVAKAKGNVSSTGATGSVVNLGTISASQYLYAVLHVFGVGTSITVVVQSDDAAGMSTPTNRITIGPITTQGGTWATRLAGPLTETHYRFNVTSVTGTFSIAGAIAVDF